MPFFVLFCLMKFSENENAMFFLEPFHKFFPFIKCILHICFFHFLFTTLILYEAFLFYLDFEVGNLYHIFSVILLFLVNF